MLRPDVALSLPGWLSQFGTAKLRQPTWQRLCIVRTQEKNLMGTILFLYYEESLLSSNLISKLLWFLSVRPIEHPKIIQKVSLSASILKKDYKNNCV